MQTFSIPLLAIDYGTVRVGVAISYGTLAEPLLVLPNDEKLFSQLQQLCTEYHIEQLLVGVSEREMAERSLFFGKQLEEKLSLPVVFADETLSSVEVQRKLAEKNRGKQQYKGAIDHYAAAQILQQYLDDHMNS